MRLIIAIAVLSIASASFADMPARYLHGVKIDVGGRELSGYIALESKTGFNPDNADALKILKAEPRIWLVSDLGESRIFCDSCEPPPLISAAPSREINPKDIRKVTRAKGPFDGRVGNTIIQVPKKAFSLIISGEPIFHCVGHYAEIDDNHWLSYNKKIGAKELQPLCDRTYETRPSADEIKAALKPKDVFYIKVHGD